MKRRIPYIKKDILHGKIAEQLILLVFPLFVGYLLQMLYGFVDSMILGRLIGKEALAAVGGSANSMINIMLNCVSGIAAAITVLVAQSYGRGNMEKVNRAVRTGLFVSIVLGIILAILMIIASPGWLRIMKNPEETFRLSLIYMYLYFASLPFYFVYQTGISVLRALGDSKRPLLFILLTAVCKIVFDLLLAGAFRLGVTGTSIATFLSHLICALAIVFVFEKTSDVYQVSFRELRCNKEDLLQIVKIGLPFAIQNMMFAIPNAMLQYRINLFGTEAVAAYSAFSSVDGLFWCYSNSISTATITIASQNFGSRNMERVRKTNVISALFEMVGAILFGGILLGMGKELLMLFLKEEGPLMIAERMIRVIAFSYVTNTLVEPMAAVFKSCGMVRAPMIIALFTVCISRILYVSFFPIDTPVLVLFAFPLSWILTSIVYIFYYLSKRKVFYS